MQYAIPHPALLESMRRQITLPWRDLFGELIDNSFDAQASRVEISITGRSKRVCIRDDGHGCDDMLKMLTLGEHYRRPGTKLGRYGVGLKDVGCSLWGEMVIETTAKGLTHKCTMDWPALSKTTDWSFEDPVSKESDRASGTLIDFQRITKRTPHGKELEKLADDLGFVFAPALRDGKQIVIVSGKRKWTCKAYELPMLDDVVEDRFEVNGQWVKLRVGIVKDGEKNSRPGFVFYHAHRTIQNSGLGAGNYSIERIAGEVELGPKWILSKNKTGLAEGAEELGEAIFHRCKSILERSKMKSRELRADGLSQEIGSRLFGMLTRGKEKRGAGEQKGAAKNKDTGRKRRRAKNIQPGDKVLDRLSGGLIQDWVRKGGETLGAATLIPARIDLDLDHPWILKLFEERNADGLTQLALMVFAEAVAREDDRGRLPFPFRNHNTVFDALGEILSKIPGITPVEEEDTA